MSLRLLLYSCFLWICLLAGSQSAYSQGGRPLVIDTIPSFWDLTSFAQAGPDINGDLEWQAWLSRPQAFSMKEIVSWETPISVEKDWWLHITLRSELPLATDWVFYLPPVGVAEAYLFDSTELISLQYSGKYILAKNKPENKGPDVHIPLNLKPFRNYDLLVKLSSVDKEPILLEPRLYSMAEWNRVVLEERTPIIHFFQGVFWIMLVYNLVLFFSVRFAGYFYYALYLLCLSVFVSFAVGELTHPTWGDPRWWRPLGLLAFGAINVCYFQFSRLLLNLKKELPKWDKWMRGYIRLKMLVLVLVQIELLVWFDVAMALQIEFLFLLFDVFFSLTFFVRLLRTGKRIAYYFVLGSGSVIVIGLGLASLGHLLDLKYTFVIFLCTVVVEIIFFSLSLAHRIRSNERNRLKTQQALNEELSKVNTAFGRFVPHEFLRSLGRKSVLDIQLGDSVEKEVTVLFSDIRGYTALSEQMTPQENFKFLNAYLGRMGPVIQTHRGFVNQYYGDGIMALFLHGPDDALKAALGMLRTLDGYNEERKKLGRIPIRTGIGLHTGPLMMGVMGDTLRLEAGVVSDTVNTTSRMEGLTKHYHARLILSQEVLMRIKIPERQACRFLGKVQVKGRIEPVGVYECYAEDPKDLKAAKISSLGDFEHALGHYFSREFSEAIVRLDAVLGRFPDDLVAQRYRTQALHYLTEGVSEDWTGVELMLEK